MERHWYVVLRAGGFVGAAVVPFEGDEHGPFRSRVGTRERALEETENMLCAAGPFGWMTWDGVDELRAAREGHEELEGALESGWEEIAVLDSARWPQTVATLELMETIDAALN